MYDSEGNSVAAPQFDLNDLTRSTVGFGVATPGECGNVLDRFYEEAPFSTACALVVRKTCYESLMSKDNRGVRQRYHIDEVTLYFAEKEGQPPTKWDCLLIQLGQEAVIRYDDMSHKVTVTGAIAEKIRVSIQIANYQEADDFHKDHRTNFAKAALAAIGPKLVYKDAVPFWTRTISDFVHKGKTLQRHDGFVDISTDKLEEAWRRSGTNDFDIRAIGKEPFVPIHLPPTTTRKEARAKAQLLDTLGFGTVATRSGFAIRVMPESRIKAEKILNPEYSELIGDTLLTMPKGDGVKIEIIGVPRHMDNSTLVQQLTMATLGEPWKCKPTGTLKSAAYGRKTVLAVASTMPPRTNIKVDIAGEMTMVTIRQHMPPKNQMTHWDKIGKDKENDAAFPTLEQRSTNLGARPKAKPAQPSAWTRNLIDDNPDRYSGMSVGQVYALRELEAASNGCPIDDDDDDDDDNDKDSNMGVEPATTPPRTQAFPRTAVTHSTIPAARPAKDNLLERLMNLKKESEDVRKESDERHNRAQEQFETFQRDVDTKMTVIGDTLAVLKDSIQGNNTMIDDRMAKTESAIVNLANKLDQMFAVFEQKWNAPTNNTNQGWGQHSWDSSRDRWHDVEDSEEHEQELGGPSTEAPRDHNNY
jgi:hypothetical protein